MTKTKLQTYMALGIYLLTWGALLLQAGCADASSQPTECERREVYYQMANKTQAELIKCMMAQSEEAYNACLRP